MKKHLFLILVGLVVLFYSSCNSESQQDNADQQVKEYKNTTTSTKAPKKILVISSSPRNGGNSDVLCDQFIKGAQEAGHQAEKVFLNDKKINFFVRDDYTEKDTIIRDDAPAIVQKMVSADVIVMATPIYFYAMCGQMKTMIDRTYDRHGEIEGKEFYYIMTAADRDMKAFRCTIEEFRGFLDCLKNASECGIIYGPGTWGKGDVEKTPAMQEAYKMGKNS